MPRRLPVLLAASWSACPAARRSVRSRCGRGLILGQRTGDRTRAASHQGPPVRSQERLGRRSAPRGRRERVPGLAFVGRVRGLASRADRRGGGPHQGQVRVRLWGFPSPPSDGPDLMPLPGGRVAPQGHRARGSRAAAAARRAKRPESSVSRAVEESNRRMLRARDAMDRDYAKPLDIPTLARIAYVSEAHFIRVFRSTFGETPHRYLQRRRVERAMFLLRETDRSVTEISLDVGFNSLGTFTRTFSEIVGDPPSTYRWRADDLRAVPACFAKAWTRPSSFGEARRRRAE